MSALHHPHQIFDLLATEHADDDYALVILTAVDGGTLRARGAVMAVTAHGFKHGYISQGCVDADITAQCLKALKANTPLQIIYGEGSPFKDITLPCAGKIELAIIPRPDSAVIKEIHEHLKARKEINIYLDKAYELSFNEGNRGQHFHYAPPLQLIAAGRGEALTSLCRQAENVGMKVKAFSPNPKELDFETLALVTPDRSPDLRADKWSAAVLLFHDHDWEASILDQLLNSNAFYIGAMGSMRTHKLRVKTLMTMGWNDQDIARIHSPIGHLSGLRDGGWLGASIIADIASAAREKGLL